MYSTNKINIESIMNQIGMRIRPYEIRLNNEKNDDGTKIKYVYISTSDSAKRSINTSIIHDFNEDMTAAKFNTSFHLKVGGRYPDYPFGIHVIDENKDFIKRFHRIEDYLTILHILSNKSFTTGVVEVKGDIDFTQSAPVINNPEHLIRPLMFNFGFKDNINNLSPFDYIDEKLVENGMFYEREKMKDIVAVFEMLLI